MAHSRRQRKWQRKAKQERRNLKLWAEGARDTVLAPHVEAYADALSRGHRSERDYWVRVCTEYHARIGWRLQDHEEPELPLPVFDPSAPAAEEELNEEEQEEKRKRVTFLNERIRRWLKYRARRLNTGLVNKVTDPSSPYAALMVKLTGQKAPPKARQAYQQFQHENLEMLRKRVAERWVVESVDLVTGTVNPSKPDAPYRAKIAREAFAQLPEEERLAYGKRATAEAAVKREAYQKALEEGAPKTPEGRQKCINNLPGFLGAILTGVAEYTGLQMCVLMGGRIPKYGGQLSAMHLAVGRNLDTVPASFANWKEETFQKDVIGFYKNYLATCYTAEMCAEAALPDNNPLSDAQYTIAAEKEEASDSESDSEDSGSDSDSDSDSDSSDSEVETQGKKRKRSAKSAGPSKTRAKKAKSASPPPLSMEQRRALAMQRNAKILEQIDLKHGGSALVKELGKEKGKQKEKQKKTKQQPKRAAPAPRRVTRSIVTTQPAVSLSNTLGSSSSLAGMVMPSTLPAEMPSTSSAASETLATLISPTSTFLAADTPMPLSSPGGTPSSSTASETPATLTSPTSTSLAADTPMPLPSPGETPSSTASETPSTSSSPAEKSPTSCIAADMPMLLSSSADTSASPSSSAETLMSLSSPTEKLTTPCTAADSPMPLASSADTGASSSSSAETSSTPSATAATPKDRTGGLAALLLDARPVREIVRGKMLAERREAQDEPMEMVSPCLAEEILVDRPTSPPRDENTAPNASRPDGATSTEAVVPGEDDAELGSCPDDAPEGFKKLFEEVSREELGKKYQWLLQAYISLEREYGFKDGSSRIPADYRPKEVKDWIQNARHTRKFVAIPNTVKFGMQWRKWWDALQPKESEDGAAVKGQPRTQAEWGPLVAPGINGIVSVVAALYWWGCAEKRAGREPSREWEVAVEEVESICYKLKGAARDAGLDR